jgi:3-phosphoshikimate 1-carboxyvinyltransferase
MRNAIVSFTGKKNINAEITLTGSKSESNRALIIAGLSDGLVKINNLSDAADTVTLNSILHQVKSSQDSAEPTKVDVGHAGTAMRFLTAYLAIHKGSFYITGSGRMKERPIRLLVDALNTLGAKITYSEQEGFPPLNISDEFDQSTPTLKIQGNVSSQYLSALLMIAPVLPMGLSLEITGELTSTPYLKMTLQMLEEAGIAHEWIDQTIKIADQPFVESTFTVEPDWSASSYWYSIAALSDSASISLPNLKVKSLQGDSRIQEIMELFGIHTSRNGSGILLIKDAESALETEILDLKDCPDLAQTIIVCAAAKGLNLKFTGLETLKIKETDRIFALQTELQKIGVRLIEENQVYTLDCESLIFPEHVVFNTYDDHRMAMAFAPLSLLISKVEIEDFMVVEKSYPAFYEDLKLAGFEVTEV